MFAELLKELILWPMHQLYLLFLLPWVTVISVIRTFYKSFYFFCRKYEEICAPRVEEFCFITDNTYTKAEVYFYLKSEGLLITH
jgi:hypothetical protein